MKAASLACLILWTTAASSPAYDHELPPTCDPGVYEQIIPSLESVMIPDYEYVDVAPNELLEFWRAIKRKAPPSWDTNTFLKVSSVTPTHVSLTTNDDSFLSAIDKLCAVAELTWQFTPGGLTIQRRAEE